MKGADFWAEGIETAVPRGLNRHECWNRCLNRCREAKRLPALRYLARRSLTVPLPSCVVQAAGPSKNPNAPVPPRPKNRFDTRLQELEASLSGGSGGGSSSGSSSGGGGGRKAKNVSGVTMAGGLLLTSQEYTAHVSDLRKEVEEAWSKDEKVVALKVTVQVLLLLLLLLLIALVSSELADRFGCGSGNLQIDVVVLSALGVC